MSEQQAEPQKELQKAPGKVNVVGRTIAGLLMLGGSIGSAGVIGANIGYSAGIQRGQEIAVGIHQTQEAAVNEYGVWLEDGTEFNPPDNTVIKGSVVLEDTGEELDGLSAVYVTGERVNPDSKIMLRTKGSVYVTPQQDAGAVVEEAKVLASDLAAYNSSRGNDMTGKDVIIKTLPGFETPKAE
jgi:hypothetical protein